MKIDEPKTPYEYASGNEDEDEEAADTTDVASGEEKPRVPEDLDANLLAAK